LPFDSFEALQRNVLPLRSCLLRPAWMQAAPPLSPPLALGCTYFILWNSRFAAIVGSLGGGQTGISSAAGQLHPGDNMSASWFCRLGSAIAAAILAASAQAQGYPAKPIRVIVGFTAGGGTDVVARLLGQKISESFGQPVIVENRIGASGIIAAEYVAKASPDGYTLLVSPSTVFTINPIMFAKLSYSPLRDFVPVSKAVSFPFVMVVSASQPIRSIKELVDFVKANPGSANYGGPSGLFQLALELFKQRTGTRIEYIPYKGSNEALSAVMAGDVLMALLDTGPVSGPLKGGKVRGIAVTSAERMPLFPDIPTMSEAGLQGMDIEGWMGMFAPAATPLPVVRKLQNEVIRIVKLAEVKERMYSLQLAPAGNTSEEFASSIGSDIERWKRIAISANIKPAN
jgi:tripartite-type tricarboxylate transporter receptor subunit TctC